MVFLFNLESNFNPMMNVVCGLILMHNNEHPFHTKQNSKQGGISRRNEQNQLHVSTLHNSKKIS